MKCKRITKSSDDSSGNPQIEYKDEEYDYDDFVEIDIEKEINKFTESFGFNIGFDFDSFDEMLNPFENRRRRSSNSSNFEEAFNNNPFNSFSSNGYHQHRKHFEREPNQQDTNIFDV